MSSRSPLLVLVLLLFACSGAQDAAESAPVEPSASQAAVATPVEASPIGPSASDLIVITPVDGELVMTPIVRFVGTAPIGARIVRDISLAPDEEVTAVDGTWALDVELKEGVNEVSLRIGDNAETERTIRITYNATAAASADATASPTPEPTAVPTPRPTPVATAAPTPKPTAVEYKKLSDRSWQLIVKNPDKYMGRTYQIWGCITQFDAATGPDTFRAQASNKNREYWYSDGDNALFTGDEARLESFVQDDVVSMNVLMLGAYTYDTQVGGSTTVPWFSVARINRRGSCE
jgi:hypothetical protein